MNKLYLFLFSINAGCDALPALLSIKDVMKQRKVDGIWKGNDELPVSNCIFEGLLNISVVIIVCFCF